ncbi:MAG: PD-(D/E)XK nuclease family protein [Candidatus Sulfotelmatobacter sp.]
MWSVSTAKMFDRCQRQWFYKAHVASAKAQDDVRRLAYLLSKLQSVSAWRGNVVDHVLSKEVIPAIQRGGQISAESAIASAMRLFDRQLAVALEHRIHETGFRPSALGDDFAAFHAMEYGRGVTAEEIEQARQDVRHAIETFFSMGKLLDRLASARRLVTQRHLFFSHGDTTVRAVPDVIVFSDHAAPAIIDWKVHAFGRHDAWLQLAVYASGLTRTTARLDYQVATDAFAPEEIGLLEVQLITGALRRHRLSADDVDRADAYIARSAEAMALAIGDSGEKACDLPPESFPAARYASSCETCAYRRMCWETLQ